MARRSNSLGVRLDVGSSAVGALSRRVDAGLSFDHGYLAALRPVREKPLGDPHAIAPLGISDVVCRHRNDGVVYVDNRNSGSLRFAHCRFEIGVGLGRYEEDARALCDHRLGDRKLSELIALVLGGLVGYRHADLFTEVLVSLAEEAPVFVRQCL